MLFFYLLQPFFRTIDASAECSTNLNFICIFPISYNPTYRYLKPSQHSSCYTNCGITTNDSVYANTPYLSSISYSVSFLLLGQRIQPCKGIWSQKLTMTFRVYQYMYVEPARSKLN